VCGKPLDARTDIFSFGVLLYEMLSGKNLFSRVSQAETISAVLNYEPPIAKTLADAPKELQRIVRKALIKNRDERYQTAKDLLVDLKGLQKRLEFEAELFRERENIAASSSISASPRPSVSESPLPPNNLPKNLSPIIGREKEITAIGDLLQSENVQLITMTGIGGTGKTRLAQAIARRLVTSFDKGVFFVELAAVTDAEQVASNIAQTFGVKEAGGKPILEILKKTVGERGRIEVMSVAKPVKMLAVEGFRQKVVRFTTDIPHLPNWGQPLLLGAGSILVAHTKDEFVMKSDLEEAVELYVVLAKNLLTAGKTESAES
jgi:hypothetical protein